MWEQSWVTRSPAGAGIWEARPWKIVTGICQTGSGKCVDEEAVSNLFDEHP